MFLVRYFGNFLNILVSDVAHGKFPVVPQKFVKFPIRRESSVRKYFENPKNFRDIPSEQFSPLEDKVGEKIFLHI